MKINDVYVTFSINILLFWKFISKWSW